MELIMTLAQQFAAYSEWRTQLSQGIEAFRRCLSENELSDAQTELRIGQLLETLREDRLHVAFVAEFSRGKSELINAIFFANYGNRMLPSTAGRTTMCPTELMFDAGKPPSIELLPIQTREGNASISEYKRFPDEWDVVPLDTERRIKLTLHRSVKPAGDANSRKPASPRPKTIAGCALRRRHGRNSTLAPCHHQLPAPAATTGAGHS
jgi:hypothetical protein